MDSKPCLSGCSGDSVRLTGTDSTGYNAGNSGERNSGGRENGMPPLPEPVVVPPVSFPGGGGSAGYPSWDQGGGEPGTPCDYGQNYDSPGLPRMLQEGCYYIRLMPTSLHTPSRFQFEGTLRFQRTGGTMIASGDLYKKDFCESPTYCPSVSATEDNQAGIPIFPRRQYGYYLRVTRLRQVSQEGSGTQILLEMEPFRFDHSNQSWEKSPILTAQLKYAIGPDGIHYWRGDVQTGSQVVMGNMLAVRISSYLRQAVVEIDRVAESECPGGDETGSKWLSVFKKAGWDITIDISDKKVQRDETGENDKDRTWSNSELHRKMLEYREKVNLDEQWRYHMLAVPKLNDGTLGVMYDNTIKGINDIPREGAAVASHAVFPDDEWWGECRGGRFGQFSDPYIRTAIHEIGHAMMLYHPDNPYENYMMQKTVHLARNVGPLKKFPKNIEWSFSPRDTHMLCHLPDIAIRPGGVCFGTPHQRLPVNARDEVVESDGLQLVVEALEEVVPIGAPVRVNFTLINRSQVTKLVPGSLRMKSGHVSGRVIDPLGTAQDFATILRYTSRNKEDVMPKELKSGQRISHSATLLWGTEGPLFPCSGYYRVNMVLNWYLEGMRMRVSGNAGIMVTPPESKAHARAALRIFDTPEAILTLAVGGDHLEVGNEVIRQAIGNPVLKPHYELVEAKRVGQRFYDRPASLADMEAMMDEATIMSPTEVIRFAKILKGYAEETPKEEVKKEVVENLISLLLKKVSGTTAEDVVEELIREVREQLEQ